ncbi:3'-5' exonuclease [Longimicrobium sp.]|uniref:3'-5' exonuclease n=1 Tax=Longimicrobium sp. TaxID=2029185 RepID=UPI002E338234|nr:exonuclease domain-containing protein [Longimicrobium sp.]HEX6037584.1 exonuclease domain-containing protein [Longimicrobium sp.]
MSQLMFPLDNVRLERDGSLTDRALRVLSVQPLPSVEVAHRVLGITGGAGAAAAAVFTLLGGDARFTVDAQGVWSVASAPVARPRRADAGTDEAEPAGPVRLLRDERWVVVDVETTGGTPTRGHRVTEVAAVRVEGGRIADTYCTLVNPERPIPGMITSLTGISNTMVADQPRFAQVARDVSSALEGCVFVAHNAAFDWRFVSHELSLATGMTLSGRQLCTVRLSRRLLPQLPSRSLDGLAHWFGLEVEHRHRALDDAVATAKVLLRLLDMLEDQGVTDWDGLQGMLRKRKPRASRKRRAKPQSMEVA